MVAGHVIGDASYNGMKVADDSLLRYVYYTFQFLRMPLFTVISGYVYALRPADETNTLVFLKGKTRRILLPFLTFGTLQYIFRCIVPGINKPAVFSHIWKIFIFTFDQFWFLQSIFLVFIFVSLLERYHILSNLKSYAIILGIAAVLYFFRNNVTTVFSFDGFLYLLPFFLLGLGINRYLSIFRKNYIRITFVTLLVLGITVQQLIWFSIIPEPGKHLYNTLALTIGVSGTITLFYLKKPMTFLAGLGYYSYGIYLMHVFGTASSRIFFVRMGIENNLIIFLLSLGFGLALPVLAELIIMKNRYLKLMFLGLKR